MVAGSAIFSCNEMKKREDYLPAPATAAFYSPKSRQDNGLTSLNFKTAA